MKKATIIKITGLSASLLTLSLIAWGLQRKVPGPVKPVVILTGTLTKKQVFDPVLLAKYERIYQKYDTLKTTVTMAGSMEIHDPADSTENMKNVGFLFCKKGDRFYYKLGTTETINADGICLYIDNLGQTMMISEQKKIAYDQQPGEIMEPGKLLGAGGYALSGKMTGHEQTLSLINEHHGSCKQFSLSYDTLNMQVDHLYARLTNIQAPLSNDQDKVVNISISQWTNRADPEKYATIANTVKKGSAGWMGINRYKGYKVVSM